MNFYFLNNKNIRSLGKSSKRRSVEFISKIVIIIGRIVWY